MGSRLVLELIESLLLVFFLDFVLIVGSMLIGKM